MESVGEMRPGDSRAVAEALALAFEDDPITAFLFPDPASRVRRITRFYRFAIRHLVRHGAGYTDDGIRGGAIWQAPSPPRSSRRGALWAGVSMLATLRSAARRASDLNDTVMRAHYREPHWYLALLGTVPAHQGHGLGSQLLAPVLARCDDTGLPAYLESSKESNIPFYERHGFRVVGELQIPDGPSVWPMLRDPRSSG